ncbi:sigma-70 family RNA polymerase sigma factor [Paenibacillus radicis (ex Xue et al. 2023)]|uniref:Sigma-70 family RNA polymerase sigma factor n=1 Tax=Paenibacillus radicis (ex Xue et al. 2023) TaxID=2972489 RepID=A0ABT1YB30_9BACL|nr:sigma-70 family RNA polymerase sigma factor [Paenibacillus radicis (ex Xue et al. 2023)]MCR8630400.1 sigma-70 family RNA polymerase sigma factor [Paenibacillus radicis (ex Xue et al. 2023)]
MRRHTLDSLYQLYVKDVYRYLLSLCRNHHAAEDLVQETFYRAYLYLDNCKDDKVKPWLFRVAYNAFVDSYRKEQRSIPIGAEFFVKLPDTRTPDQHLLNQELWEHIGNVIHKLPHNQMQAILLHDFHGLSYQESADIMEIRLSHFKILLYRARQAIRQTEERKEHL